MGVTHSSQPCSTLLPFFPEVYEEVQKSCKAPFTARSRFSASSTFTTLDGGASRGYIEISQVERGIAAKKVPVCISHPRSVILQQSWLLRLTVPLFPQSLGHTGRGLAVSDTMLTVLTSIKRVGDMQAFSVSETTPLRD